MSTDAVVVGSGPNGLAAAVMLARAGRSVVVLEAEDTVGGGTRSASLTLPGFTHDVCSAVHPLAVSSPFFRSVDLARHGLRFVHPDLMLAHPFDDGSAAFLARTIEDTVTSIPPDATPYRKLVAPMVRAAEALVGDILGPLRPPHHPIALSRFGLRGIRSAAGLAQSVFEGDRARAIFAGVAAHSMLPLDRIPTAAFALMLVVLAHHAGWPFAAGGSQAIADALVAELDASGVKIATGRRITSTRDLPDARATLFDLTPRQILEIAGDRFPARYRKRLARFRYGPGVFKVDWALSEPIPWRAEASRRAGTVHLGATLTDIAASEDAVWRGEAPARPFVILAQPTLFDPSRAPSGRHTAWAYCHVPAGSEVDMTERIEAQVERFAPGFRDVVLARHTMGPREVEAHNANYIGGDVNAGVQDLRQLWTRPAPRWTPYATPARDLYICSASTPPGGGVHGMCGYHAARAALRRALR